MTVLPAPTTSCVRLTYALGLIRALLCWVWVVFMSLQVHGALAASPGQPRSTGSVRELLRLMLEAACKPILWYLTAAGFLVGAGP